MNNRTMATVCVDRDSISLKTRSRSGCSPQHFIILKKELQRLEEKTEDFCEVRGRFFDDIFFVILSDQL